MFYVLAIASAFGYALQNTLMASFYRRIDGLLATGCRGVSLGLSMLPLLFFVPQSDFGRVLNYLPYLLPAAVCAAVGNWSSANSYRYFPVGVALALNYGTLIVTSMLIGVFFFEELLGIGEILWIGILIIACIEAVRPQRARSSITSNNILLGLGFGVLSGTFGAFAFALMSVVSRAVHPFVAGYLWELLIGLIALAVVFVRGKVRKRQWEQVTLREFGQILLFSSPTVIGTGCFALAVTKGSIAPLTAIVSSSTIIGSVLAYFIHGEKLEMRQYIAIVAVVMAIVGMKLST